MNNRLIELKDREDPPVFAFCEDCSWEGLPSDCETFEDSDGWENPSYLVAICPKCGEENVIFLRQSEVDKMKEEKENL